MTGIQDAAGTVAKIDEGVLEMFPYISGMIEFVPGGAAAAPFMPLVKGILQAVDNAAKDIQQGNPTAAVSDILAEIRNTLTPGLPNSAILSSPPVKPVSNASAQASG